MEKIGADSYYWNAEVLRRLTRTRQDLAIRYPLKLVAMLTAFSLLSCLYTATPTNAFQDQKPRVREISVQKLTLKEDDPSKASIVVNIGGEKFGKPPKAAAVKLINQDTGARVNANIVSHADDKIVANADVPVGEKAAKYVFQVSIDNVDVIAADHLSDYTIEVKKEKKDTKPKPFEITFETFKSEQYPNLYSLVVTNKTKDNDPGFSPNPNLMRVDIIPAGATNISIQPGSGPNKLLVTFLAPEKFEVKDVLVTVFDPNMTLGSNTPKAYATKFTEKAPKADPNQPTISNIEVTALSRRSGFGRLKIEGSGFGDYQRPPMLGEQELLCCINRPSNPTISTEVRDRRQSSIERDAKGNNKPNQQSFDPSVCPVGGTKCEDMANWRRKIQERVNVILTPRNPDLRAERTQILYIDDRTIDVYFEFTRYEGYSEPFRLANATVTINKGAVEAASSSDDTEGEVATAVLSGPKTYFAAHDIGPSRDKNLEYRYAILETNDANRQFGRGVGEHFYVIELTVINNGKKKVAVPLGSIQAEIEWVYGDTGNGEFFEEGPPTLPPLTLGSVTAQFDAYQKAEGKRAKLFNILDGITTLGAALVPVFGRNIERPTTILSGGLIPGLKKAYGDLSSEQLQRLTSMSWESVEEIPAGGSQNKFVYIPKADTIIGNPVKIKSASGTTTTVTRKQVVNIRGIEVSGFEILESEQKLATPQ